MMGGDAPRRWRVTINVLIFVTTISFILAGLALSWRFSESNTLKARQRTFNAEIANVQKQDCLEIEKLKKGFRVQAIKQFNQLDQTLALLNLKKTPAIVRRATQDRDQTLHTYKAKGCPRPVTPQEAK